MLSHADHDALVSSLYAAGAGDSPWTMALARLSAAFRVEHNVIHIADPSWRTVAVEVHGETTDHALDYYAGEIYANDPRTPYLHRVAPGSVYYDHMLYDVGAMNREYWCREAVAALGVKYQLGVGLTLPDGMHGAFALLQTEQEGHACEATIAAFTRLAPHVEQAVALGLVMDREAATRSALLEALARKVEGVVLLDRGGVPTFLNDAARAMLDSRDGLELVKGEFKTRRLPETRRLQLLVRGVLASPGETPGGRVLVSRPSGRPPFVVSVMASMPLERFLAGRSIACVVHLQDLAAVRLPSREALRAVFGLSDRETDLAIELVRCVRLERAAANARMALNTARNHLQSISRKTGAHGQAELIQLIGRLD